MASRRNLKKAVKNICGELFADCVAVSLCEQGDRKQLDELMVLIMATYQDYVARISHAERGHEKAFFRKLRTDFSAQANKISEAIVKA